MATAQRRVQEIEAAYPHTLDRIELIEGDITAPDLGIDPAARDSLDDVNEVWHLAAIYDLTVAEPIAHRVNVEGTAQVLAFCQSRP
jgi:thioester reductase-like protein